MDLGKLQDIGNEYGRLAGMGDSDSEEADEMYER